MWIPNSILPVFADIDECAQTPSPCDATNGGCTNSDGSYTCTCNTGYSLDTDGITCIGEYYVRIKCTSF